METAPTMDEQARDGVGSITVRYFAGARAAAGVESEQVPAAAPRRLADLSAELSGRHGAALAEVLVIASFLVDEVVAGPDAAVPVGAVVDVLPPFAGG